MKQLLVFVLAVFTLTLSAQNKPKHEKVAAKQIAQWVEVCGLSADQEAKLSPVLTAMMKEMIAAKETDVNNKEQLKTARKEIHKKFRPQIKEIVGEENMIKMKEHRKQQKELKKQ